MKVEINYVTIVTEVVTVPKEWEFYFKKDESEYTDKEWDVLEGQPFLNLRYDDIEVERIVEE